MDPLSQGLVGTSISHLYIKNRRLILLSIIAFLSAMSPDLDVLFRSDEDPLIFLEYHRQFTHSLIFIPFGGLICTIFFYYVFAKRYEVDFKTVYIVSTISYATHGLVDATTSYGTQLYWPFSNERVAFNLVSVIDPLFTLPILLFLFFSIMKKNYLLSILSVVWMLSYYSLSKYQEQRVTQYMNGVILEREHEPNAFLIKPSFANIIVWKSIYEHSGKYYVDAIKVGVEENYLGGTSIEKLDIDKSFPWLDKTSQQARDIERFRWFANGYLSVSPVDSMQIIDVRYSTLPNKVLPLWSIALDKRASNKDHIKYVTSRSTSSRNYKELIKMIFF